MELEFRRNSHHVKKNGRLIQASKNLENSMVYWSISTISIVCNFLGINKSKVKSTGNIILLKSKNGSDELIIFLCLYHRKKISKYLFFVPSLPASTVSSVWAKDYCYYQLLLVGALKGADNYSDYFYYFCDAQSSQFELTHTSVEFLSRKFKAHKTTNSSAKNFSATTGGKTSDYGTSTNAGKSRDYRTYLCI